MKNIIFVILLIQITYYYLCQGTSILINGTQIPLCCKVYCGDGICTNTTGENCQNCPQDCCPTCLNIKCNNDYPICGFDLIYHIDCVCATRQDGKGCSCMKNQYNSYCNTNLDCSSDQLCVFSKLLDTFVCVNICSNPNTVTNYLIDSNKHNNNKIYKDSNARKTSYKCLDDYPVECSGECTPDTCCCYTIKDE